MYSKKPCPFSDSRRRIRAEERRTRHDRRRNGAGEDHTGDLSIGEAPTCTVFLNGAHLFAERIVRPFECFRSVGFCSTIRRARDSVP